MDPTDNLMDVDAVLATWIKSADDRQPLAGMEAVATRAILALSRTTAPGAQQKARDLFVELLEAR
jgi:hypothetical protein